MKKTFSLYLITLLSLLLPSSVFAAAAADDSDTTSVIAFLRGPETQKPLDPDEFKLYPFLPDRPAILDSAISVSSIRLGYGVDPDLSTLRPGVPTISPKVSVSVSGTGAAGVNVPIECPVGLGTIQPNVQLAYNSLASNGIAGFGFNISGISVITCGAQDIFHDGKAMGRGNGYEALYLDGTRLMLVSGKAGVDGAVYTPVTDPFTRITVHGSYGTQWLSVKTADGNTIKYGETESSRQTYGKDGSSYSTRYVNSWYVSSVEDPLGNQMTFSYEKDKFFVYPKTISYGSNTNKANGLVNEVEFNYESRNDKVRFVLGADAGCMDKRLASIVTKSQGHVYRKYNLVYNSYATDGIKIPFSRLTSVTVENGLEDKLKPINIGWNTFSSNLPSVKSLPLSLRSYDINSRMLCAGDLNGDGISDLIDIRNEKNYVGGVYKVDNYCYVYPSRADASGNISFGSWYCMLPKGRIAEGNNGDERDSPMSCDVDGDGFGDVVIPMLRKGDNGSRNIELDIVLGKDVVGRVETFRQMYYSPKTEVDDPLYSVADFDCNGKSEVLVLEDVEGDGGYQGAILKYDGDKLYSNTPFQISLDKQPKKIFTSDYNNDGLADLLVVYDSGYRVFFNSGGGTVFKDNNALQKTTLKDYLRLEEGDFNGDGVPDFLYYDKGKKRLFIAFGKGDGDFNVSQEIKITDDFKIDDENYFRLMVYDINHDGLSDVVIEVFMGKLSRTMWMISDGSTLKLLKTATNKVKDHSYPGKFALGDFNGDGATDMVNYGNNCLTDANDNTKTAELHLYTNETTGGKGKVSRVTDGFGVMTQIQYKTMAAGGGIYTRDVAGENLRGADMINYTLPMELVSEITKANGAAGGNGSNAVSTKYKYGGLKVNLKGKGLIGFTTTEAANEALKTTERTTVTAWNAEYLMPAQTTDEKIVGSAKQTTQHTTVFTGKGNKRVFTSSSTDRVIDFDGNVSVKTVLNDTNNGYVLSEKTDFGGGMYKQTEYLDYENINGMWLPGRIVSTQKHSDDSNVFSSVAAFVYDGRGQKTAVIENSGTPKSLRTEYTYDTFGNVLSSVTSGDGITPVTNHNEYDQTGRFVVRKHTTPSSAVNTFTYDAWGDLLTETDCTVEGEALTTTHEYNGWGQEVRRVSPTGEIERILTGWGNDRKKLYYTASLCIGKPWVKTWYDECGREVLSETIGAKDISISEETSYNVMGLPVSKETKTGNLTTTETMTYDDRGRVLSDVFSTGKTVTSQYGNRKVTLTDAGRTYTREYDAWGALKKATDPAGSVEYKYSSQGQPSEVSSCGATVRIEYDEAGNRVRLEDPDAGTITSKYDAAGRVTEHTDGRGKTTRNTYDEFGRLATSDADGLMTIYEYGTSGRNAQRLVSKTLGDNTVEYGYDRYGRVIRETRTFATGDVMTYEYEYNKRGNIAKRKYPYGGPSVITAYDTYGNEVLRKIGNDTIWQLKENTGKALTAKVLGRYLSGSTLDDKGFPSVLSLKDGDKTLREITYKYDGATGNLSSMNDKESKETHNYTYDSSDRLVQREKFLKADSELLIPTAATAALGPAPFDSTLYRPQVPGGGMTTEIPGAQRIEYSQSGNITFKTSVGDYSYDDDRPHAVSMITRPSTGQVTVQEVYYNGLGKASHITVGDRYYMELDYGPDGERWQTALYDNLIGIRQTLYGGDTERITANGITRTFFYLGDGVIWMQPEGGEGMLLYAFKDNLGSVTDIIDKEGRTLFKANYAPWGQQTVKVNSIAYNRGYTGHEMLNELGLINMNGRLYDPTIGRFLSPDNYVQLPDNSQNFNRYSYCLNNPLKYNDKTGEWFGIDDLIVGAAGFVGGYLANAIKTGDWGWSSVKSGLMSAGTSWLGYNTCGASAASSVWMSAAKVGANTLLNGLMPSISIPITSKFGFSFSPLVGFGAGGLSVGVSGSAYYNDGDFSMQVGAGVGTNYWGWNVSASYDGYGAGFGKTYYDGGSFHGTNIDNQAVGTITAKIKDFSLTFSNDILGEKERDRWRTSAVELSIGKFTIGTYVDTNWGKKESNPKPDTSIAAPAPIGPSEIGGWDNGKVYMSPIWIGYKHKNQIYRIGYSHKMVQNLTQNFVHKHIQPTPFFTDYSKFKSGMYFYSGSINPFSLWNY